MAKGPEQGDAHPNSLAARAARDPSLRRRLREGRRQADADLKAMEGWQRSGFTSPGNPLLPLPQPDEKPDEKEDEN